MGGEAQTDGRFIQMSRRKVRPFGGKWVFDFALRIGLSEPRLFLEQRQSAAESLSLTLHYIFVYVKIPVSVEKSFFHSAH